MNVKTIKQVFNTEIEKWGEISILRKVDDRVYICECSVQYEYYKIKTEHTFVFKSHFKPLHEPKCCGDLIDNRADATIFVLDDNDREYKHNLKRH